MSNNLKKEVYKKIKEFPNYEISNKGNIREKETKQIKSQSICTGGYLQVRLKNKKYSKLCLTHRLVAQTFIPNPDNLPQVNHKDEVKTNNCVENLEWCTNRYNAIYGTKLKRTSESLKGRKRRKVRCKETNEIFNYLKEASIAKGSCGASSRFISECCRGIRKSWKGFTWEYV